MALFTTNTIDNLVYKLFTVNYEKRRRCQLVFEKLLLCKLFIKYIIIIFIINK